MSVRDFVICLTASATVLCGGCCSHTDLTRTAEVQQSGILGQRHRTTQQLDLLKDKPSGTLRLVTRDYPSYPRNRRVGVVEAGTELRVNRVQRVNEVVAIMVVLPEYYSWKCTLARIEVGPHAGKEIAVFGMAANQNIATLGSALLVTPESAEASDDRAK